jgi:choline kinase
MKPLEVLIPAAGVGSRLERETKRLPKALVPVGRLPPVSHIISSYPPDTSFTVAVGHQGHLVREYLEHAHADGNVTVVPVRPFQGPGSGLCRTLSAVIDLIDGPFVFHAVDTIIDSGWQHAIRSGRDIVLVSEANPGGRYRYVDLRQRGDRLQLSEPLNRPPDGFLAYVGVAYIEDHEAFRSWLEDSPSEHSEADYLRTRPPPDVDVLEVTSWFDVGCPDGLRQARTTLGSGATTTAKQNHATYVFDDIVYKLFADDGAAAMLRTRADLLGDSVPAGVGATEHLLWYRRQRGVTLARLPNRDRLLASLLQWMEAEVWHPVRQPNTGARAFRDVCLEFYRLETLLRIERSHLAGWLRDVVGVVDGVAIGRSMADLLDQLDWEELADGIAVGWHGDLHFDNVLVGTDGSFKLLDWRTDFAGLVDVGDLYYDLAKLHHSFVLPNRVMDNGEFEVRSLRSECQPERRPAGAPTWTLLYGRDHADAVCEAALRHYVDAAGLSTRRVRVLSALVFLRMAPLYADQELSLLLWLLSAREFAAATNPGSATR